MILKDLLIQRLLVLNLCGAAALFWSWQEGYVQLVLTGDSSNICIVIFGLFLVAMLSVGRSALKISRDLNKVKNREPVDANGEKMMAKADYLFDFIDLLKGLGLFGTVVGLLMGLHGITADMGVEKIIWQLLDGLSVAFLTTAVGWVFGTWISLNARILNTAIVCLIEDANKLEDVSK